LLEIEISGTYSKFSHGLKKIFKNNSLEFFQNKIKNPKTIDIEIYEPVFGKHEP
jgi:hypothetical protein